MCVCVYVSTYEGKLLVLDREIKNIKINIDIEDCHKISFFFIFTFQRKLSSFMTRYFFRRSSVLDSPRF